MDRILILDGYFLINRANISFKPTMEQVEGLKLDYTIIYNFFRSLRALIEQFAPDKVFFVVEGGGSFRYSLYSKYKANRIVKTASIDKQENFNRQKQDIIRLLSYLPITIVKTENYEGDDTICTLIDNLKYEDIILISNDTDFIQLLQNKYNNLKIFDPIKKQFLEPPTYHYLVYKILAGDKSDNIDGLVGKKEALKLVENPKLLNEFLSYQENLENFNLNKQLIELKPFDFSLLSFSNYNIDFNALRKEFEIMEFKSILKQDYWDNFSNTFKTLIKD